MNEHIKGFNMSKIRHMRRNQGFSEIKLNDSASQTASLYDPSDCNWPKFERFSKKAPLQSPWRWILASLNKCVVWLRDGV